MVYIKKNLTKNTKVCQPKVMGWEPWAEGTAGEKKGQQWDRASSQSTGLLEEGGCTKECGLNL